MNAREVRHGQVVRVRYTEQSVSEDFVVLDRAPLTGTWWLQSLDGRQFSSAHARDMELVSRGLDGVV